MLITTAGGLIVSVSAAVSDFNETSVTFAVKLLAPAVIGVPVMVPVGERISPDGSVPADTVQTYGTIPPEADSDCEYGTPTVPFGSEVVPITGGATTTDTDRSFVALPFPLSVNRTVNAAVPAEVGEPLITPELGDSVKPCGKLPFDIAHAAGATAPDAAKLAE